MRRLDAFLRATPVSLLVFTACSQKGEPSAGGRVDDEQQLVSSGTEDRKVTLGSGDHKVTVTMKAGTLPDGKAVKTQLVSGAMKTGAVPTAGKVIHMSPAELKFAKPVTVSFGGLSAPVASDTRKKISAPVDAKSWTVGEAARTFPDPMDPMAPALWEVDALEGGVFGLTDVSGGGGPMRPFVGGNNSAVLTGPSVGSGMTPVASLRKPVALKGTGVEPGYVLGPAYAMIPNAMPYGAWVAFSIKNVTATGQCFIELENVVWKDAAGAPVGTPTLSFVSGSVGVVLGGVSTDTCLGAGETGWVMLIESDSSGVMYYQSVASIEFNLVALAPTASEPYAKIVPESYSFATPTLTVSFKNVGTGPGSVSSGLGRGVLLDTAGAPLIWGFVTDTAMTGGVLAPGATGSMDGDYPFDTYEGAGATLAVSVTFEDKPSGMMIVTPPPPGLDPVAEAAWRDDERTRREAAKRDALLRPGR